jgi:hypothetical protein
MRNRHPRAFPRTTARLAGEVIRMRSQNLHMVPEHLRPELERRAERKPERMAAVLLLSTVDLGDEAAVIVALKDAGELASDILTHMDEAIEIAREEAAKMRSVA